MDRGLDEIIASRPQRNDRGRGGRGAPRGPRREEYPRENTRKDKYAERADIEGEWVHDRYEDRHEDRYDDRPPRDRNAYRNNDRASGRGGEAFAPSSHDEAKLRIDNLHYDLTDTDMQELFSRIGPVKSARVLYDRQDRSRGIAYVVFTDLRDARQAIREFDGALAHGQPIKITLVPAGGEGPNRARGVGGSLFDRVERPVRSLFERIDNGASSSDRHRPRSYSPRNDRQAGGDRYSSNRRHSRSPIGRRDGGRERGGRQGRRGDDSGRAGRGGGRGDRGGPATSGGAGGGGGGGRRPRKTADQLDAEMDDYWNSAPADGNATSGDLKPAAATNIADNDIDMVS